MNPNSQRFIFKSRIQELFGNLLRIGLFVAMLLVILRLSAAGDEQPINQQAVFAPIPLTEIATQAIKVSDFIRELNQQVKTSQEFNEKVQEMSDAISRMASEEQVTQKMLLSNPSLERLQVEGKL
jgi:hypothetical protein